VDIHKHSNSKFVWHCFAWMVIFERWFADGYQTAKPIAACTLCPWAICFRITALFLFPSSVVKNKGGQERFVIAEAGSGLDDCVSALNPEAPLNAEAPKAIWSSVADTATEEAADARQEKPRRSTRQARIPNSVHAMRDERRELATRKNRTSLLIQSVLRPPILLSVLLFRSSDPSSVFPIALRCHQTASCS
jgi:hypothetical protein